MSKGKILFQLSGSIACFKACQLLSRLVQNDFEVEVVATSAALEFVGEATLEGLTGKKVHTDTFARGEYMNHIRLVRWADLILLCPATANSLNKLASGTADDLLGTLFLAHDFTKPYLIAPAMNTQMLRHPATQSSIETLTEWGVEFLAPSAGSLACGEIGEGRLAEPDVLFEQIARRFVTQAPTQLDLLITSGGTREEIDGVRSITNTSTGRTGAALAAYFTERGHRVTFVGAKDSVKPLPNAHHEVEFSSFSDLDGALKSQLRQNKFDAVIHAAAVSDYTVASIEADGETLKLGMNKKIDSKSELTIQLKRTPKIVSHLRDYANDPQLRVVAFKLTNSSRVEDRVHAVQKLAEQATPDFIVHNDLSEIDPASDAHVTNIFSAGATQPVARAESKRELAMALEKLLLDTTGGQK